MATRSRIGIKNQDGTIRSIYCHWDGYPSHNGKILTSHYNSRDSVNKLLAQGDISSLGETLEETKFLNDSEGDVVHQDLEEYLAYGEEYNYLYDIDEAEWKCWADSATNEVSLTEE